MRSLPLLLDFEHRGVRFAVRPKVVVSDPQGVLTETDKAALRTVEDEILAFAAARQNLHWLAYIGARPQLHEFDGFWFLQDYVDKDLATATALNRSKIEALLRAAAGGVEANPDEANLSGRERWIGCIAVPPPRFLDYVKNGGAYT